RLEIETRALRAAGVVAPVPRVKEILGDDTLVYEHVPGRPASTLMSARQAARTLTACGRALAMIHSAPVSALGATPGDGGVLVHGDFGPHTVLFDGDTSIVTGVMDWQ